jgi:hypothetical protein
MRVDAQDSYKRWYGGTVLALATSWSVPQRRRVVNAAGQEVIETEMTRMTGRAALVHFDHFEPRWREWVALSHAHLRPPLSTRRAEADSAAVMRQLVVVHRRRVVRYRTEQYRSKAHGEEVEAGDEVVVRERRVEVVQMEQFGRPMLLHSAQCMTRTQLLAYVAAHARRFLVDHLHVAAGSASTFDGALDGTTAESVISPTGASAPPPGARAALEVWGPGYRASRRVPSADPSSATHAPPQLARVGVDSDAEYKSHSEAAKRGLGPFQVSYGSLVTGEFNKLMPGGALAHPTVPPKGCIAVDWDDASRYDARALAVSAVAWASAPGHERPPISHKGEDSTAGSAEDEVAILAEAGWTDTRAPDVSRWSGQRVVPVTITLELPGREDAARAASLSASLSRQSIGPATAAASSGAPDASLGRGVSDLSGRIGTGAAATVRQVSGVDVGASIGLAHPSPLRLLPLAANAKGFVPHLEPDPVMPEAAADALDALDALDAEAAEAAKHAAAVSVSASDQSPEETLKRLAEDESPPAELEKRWAAMPVIRHRSVPRAQALIRSREGDADAVGAAEPGVRPLGATSIERSGAKRKPLTIARCLDAFTGASSLPDRTCPRCRHRGAWETTSVWRAPDVLVVHLVRFEQQKVPPYRNVKIDSHVDFPINGFSLSPWASGPQAAAHAMAGSVGAQVDTKATAAAQAAAQAAAEASASMRAARPATASGSAASGPASASSMEGSTRRLKHSLTASDFQYDLSGVVNHSGGLGSGHYTAYARLPAHDAGPDALTVNSTSPTDPEWAGQWAFFNDHSVRLVSDPQEIVSNRAYLLFYRRKNVSARNLVALSGGRS